MLAELVINNGDDAITFVGKYENATDIIKCFKSGNVVDISKLTDSKVSNVYTFATDKSGRTFVAGSGNYDRNPTIIVPEDYFDDIAEYTGTNYNIYYFEKYNKLLSKDYIKEMTVSESIKNELYKLSDAVSYTKTEAQSFNKYYQYGSIREPSFTSSHSVTNCGEIWSAYNAILDGSKFKDLSFQSVYSKSGAYLDMCENCQHTFIKFLGN